jgi:hypothetical protein
MNFRAENLYALWREQTRAADALRDESSVPPEKLLQTIWQHQRLRRGQLKTTDGKSLRVLHPGFASAEGGPDFRGAILQFENEKPVGGDVEVDLQISGWRTHGHDRNPHFQNVILRVVWDEIQSSKSKPTVFALKPFLDSPLPALALALENESGLPENLRGKCSAPLRELSAAQLSELLHAAAQARFENKAKMLLARARHCGWEQVLWENLFRALGYKHNVWPMQTLAEMKPLWLPGRDNAARCPCPFNSAFEIQARLLGVSGLLPVELTRSQKSSDTFLRRAWDFWWRERDGFSEIILPRAIWKFYGLRPANHPQRRLALAAHWLADANFISKIEAWIATDFSGGASVLASRLTGTFAPPKSAQKFAESLQEILSVERDEFWSWHWTFQSARLAKPQPLLGAARTTDLAVNVILPWLWIRAREGGNATLLREVERRFLTWPAAEDNAVLKLARQRLLGTAGARVLNGAAAQQGLLQIVRDFCGHSNAVCADCRFPELVRGWTVRK